MAAAAPEWNLMRVQVGEILDIMDPKGAWYQAEILLRGRNNDGGISVLVHFLGLSQEYNEWIPLINVHRFAPRQTKTISPYSP